MIKKVFFILFVFLSFITQTIAEPGTNAILSRLTYSDIFGALGLVFGIKLLYNGFAKANLYSRTYQTSFLLILSFFLPIFFSLNIQSTMVECLILLFLIILSIGMFQQFKESLMTFLFPLLMYTVITASVLGFYDLMASSIGLPRIFPGRTDGEALSGFRNAGQAGAYYLVMLTMLIPLRFSGLYKLLSPFNKRVLRFTLIIALVFIFITGKIAAYVGLICGVFFFLVYKRNIRAILVVSFAVLFLYVFWANLETIMPDTYNRIQLKYTLRVTENLNNQGENTFFQKNFGLALQAFEDRPLVGTGLGAFYGTYDRYEVHSTYLKMLGETGIIGTIGYAIFVFGFLTLFRIRRNKRHNPYSDYLATMLPFILGCFISWAYTYHLRKREFWILVSVTLIVHYRAHVYQEELLEEKDE